MKLRVRVDGREFTVDLGSLTQRPIRAVVDGRTFEVWPEANSAKPGLTARPIPAHQPSPAARPGPAVTQPTGPIVRAPIPGIVTSVGVRPGDTVSVGQELCVLEAMKMKNAIRATRPGTVAAVHVAPGQHVKHNDPLLEFTG